MEIKRNMKTKLDEKYEYNCIEEITIKELKLIENYLNVKIKQVKLELEYAKAINHLSDVNTLKGILEEIKYQKTEINKLIENFSNRIGGLSD